MYLITTEILINQCTIHKHSEINIDPNERIAVPMIIYQDKLKLVAFGRLGHEPVVFSLGLYNRATHNNHTSWCVILGYISNFDVIMFGNKC
jgi:hypothetical protein